ncbi:MAG: GMC family oxidoreductase, partial [Myxococcales bacterium]|nr:GMC family oxidoreductase [Myxococcales bacterium]
SGPGGAVVAKELTDAGARVVLVEEGPPFTPADYTLEGGRSMARTLREGGLRHTTGTVMPTLQAIALGGGSLVNSAICHRAPDFALDGWCEAFALAHTTRADLDPHYDAVGGYLGIAATPEAVQGPRNLLFKRGCEALGYHCEPTLRNVRGCRGSGECFSGCRSRAKQSTDITYVADALRGGACVLSSARVECVEVDGRRARGVAGRIVAPFTGRPSHRFRVHARLVVLAAGCMATPVLLLRSGNLANGSGQVGRNLQFHPGVAVMGVFPEAVHPGFGATQGYQSCQFLREGFKLETLWAPPALLAMRMPGSGRALKRRFEDIPRAAIWDAIGTCHASLGRVLPRRGSLDPRLAWRLDPGDLALLVRAISVLTEIFFAAGARSVLPGLHGIDAEIRSLDQARRLLARTFAPGDLVLGGNHAFCTTRMHGDPARGVVDELGRCHDFDNLYIADSGVFPRCPSVNPMWTLMALARRTAQAIATEL